MGEVTKRRWRNLWFGGTQRWTKAFLLCPEMGANPHNQEMPP